MRYVVLPSAGSLVLLTLLTARPAHALQPLEAFLARANVENPEVRVARATQNQREAEVDRTAGPLLPSLQAQGIYTRNQYEVAFPASTLGGSGTLTILPYNQLDATFTATVPIVDVGAWERRSAAKATRDSATTDQASTKRSVAKRVVQSYYQVLANEAVLQEAQKSLALARENAAMAATKREGGTASELDVQRSRGDIARAQQDLATATMQAATSRRTLESLSGLGSEPGGALAPDDLHAEAPLAQWLGETDHHPSVQTAMSAKRSAEKSADAAKAAWLPTISGTAAEKFTNAPSLSVHNNFYTLQLIATWKLDASVPATVRQQNAMASVASARAEKARRDAGDAIFGDWQQVQAGIEKARAARDQVAASAASATLAIDRYRGGVATQLDVLQAEQDVFKAGVSLIQAEADLAYARASLRLDSSQSIPGTER